MKRLKTIFGRIWGYLAWLLIIILAFSVVGNIRRVASIRSAVGVEQAKVDKIKEENAKLEAEIAQTSSATFIEQQVRDKLGLAKVGEAIVVLPDDETLRKLAPQVQVEADTLPDPNWKRWLKLFF